MHNSINHEWFMSKKIQKTIVLLIPRVAAASFSTLPSVRSSIIPSIRSPRAFYYSEAEIAGTSQRWVALTFSSVNQMSRHWDVETCCQFFSLFSLQFQNDYENHPFHLQCTHDPKIRYRAIMHLFRYKIELKRGKDAGMT